MLKKGKSSTRGPSGIEIGIAALLSAVLGVVLGAAYLVNKPVKKVDAIPKDASEATYYLEGKRDSNKTTAALEKRKRFAAGESVTVGEGEINVIFGGTQKSTPKAPPAKGAPPAPSAPADAPALDIGSLNTRISGGLIQFGDTITYNLYGFTGIIFVRTTGVFARRNGSFEFVPQSTYVGGCPVDRVPGLRDIVYRKLLFVKPIPDDVYASWLRLVGVEINGSTLELKMP